MRSLPRTPDAEDFRALARSSPWLWRSVRFALHWDGSPHREGLRAWVRRPDALRVETLAGDLVQAGMESPPQARAPLVSTVAVRAGADVPLLPEPPATPEPVLRGDGLRRARRAWQDLCDHDAPMFQNYYWVALLDPAELADGRGEDDAPAPGTAVEDVRAVDHHGRPAWQAVVRPTAAYDPRCSCCEMLPNPVLHARERGSGGIAPEHPEGYAYAEAFRVRLDTGTGICVRLEQLGGTEAGRRHELAVEAVDEAMPEQLFASPERPWHERLARRVQDASPGVPRGWAPYRD